MRNKPGLGGQKGRKLRKSKHARTKWPFPQPKPQNKRGERKKRRLVVALRLCDGSSEKKIAASATKP